VLFSTCSLRFTHSYMIALAGPSPDRLEMLTREHLAMGDREAARAYAQRLARGFPDHKISPPIRHLLRPN